MSTPTGAPPEAAPSLYLSLLGTARPTERGLERAGYTRSFLDRELPRLAELGMVRLHEGGGIEVIAPEVALPAFATELERQAARSRSAVDELESAYRRVRGQRVASPTIDVRVVRDLAELEAARRRVLSMAEESVLFVAAQAPINEQLVLGASGEASPLTAPGLRSVQREIVVDSAMLETPAALVGIEELMEQGILVRVRSGLAMSVLVVDRVVAVLDITNLDPSGHGSLIVRHPPLVEAMARLAEASIVSAGRPPIALGLAQRRLGEREAQTLAMLGVGLSDAAIARQTGVSVRTVERHVRRLMDELGAATRFQAGVEAARRGLV